MSENDYIAEYVKEKYPTLLGIDYAMWKLGKQFAKAVEEIAKGVENLFGSICEDNK